LSSFLTIIVLIIFVACVGILLRIILKRNIKEVIDDFINLLTHLIP
jgi:uncharacterized membrane protein